MKYRCVYNVRYGYQCDMRYGCENNMRHVKEYMFSAAIHRAHLFIEDTYQFEHILSAIRVTVVAI